MWKRKGEMQADKRREVCLAARGTIMLMLIPSQLCRRLQLRPLCERPQLAVVGAGST